MGVPVTPGAQEREQARWPRAGGRRVKASKELQRRPSWSLSVPLLLSFPAPRHGWLVRAGSPSPRKGAEPSPHSRSPP